LQEEAKLLICQNKLMKNTIGILLVALCCLPLGACGQGTAENRSIGLLDAPVTGYLEHDKLDEASGLQASHAVTGHYFSHNDSGKPYLYVIDETGRHQGRIRVKGVDNRDWEDITAMPDGNGERLLVIGDIGDNDARYRHIRLIFLSQPVPDEDGQYPSKITPVHQLKLQYPDGPRDTESLAWDPTSDRLLLISKRDIPPHVYAIEREVALSEETATLEYLGKMRPFRRPAPNGRRWSAQPTGADISPDGRHLAIISYRSLHQYHLENGQDWFTLLAGEPFELIGPPSKQEEAVTFSPDGQTILITTEQKSAPVYRVQTDGMKVD
jgi:hypothetical protein